jgi:hypothetical protein
MVEPARGRSAKFAYNYYEFNTFAARRRGVHGQHTSRKKPWNPVVLYCAQKGSTTPLFAAARVRLTSKATRSKG